MKYFSNNWINLTIPFVMKIACSLRSFHAIFTPILRFAQAGIAGYPNVSQTLRAEDKMEENIFIKQLDQNDLILIKDLFVEVFTNEPWNDDWSDENQLNKYLIDIIDNKNSLSLGLIKDNELIGISLGSIIHWCSGTEFYIREFCVKRSNQNQGIGNFFLRKIEEYLLNRQINSIILSTDIDTPAYHFYIKNNFNELSKSRFFHKNLR